MKCTIEEVLRSDSEGAPPPSRGGCTSDTVEREVSPGIEKVVVEKRYQILEISNNIYRKSMQENVFKQNYQSFRDLLSNTFQVLTGQSLTLNNSGL